MSLRISREASSIQPLATRSSSRTGLGVYERNPTQRHYAGHFAGHCAANSACSLYFASTPASNTGTTGHRVDAGATPITAAVGCRQQRCADDASRIPGVRFTGYLNRTLVVNKATQSANLVYAGPTTGSAAAPTFRALVAQFRPSNPTLRPLNWRTGGQAGGGVAIALSLRRCARWRVCRQLLGAHMALRGDQPNQHGSLTP